MDVMRNLGPERHKNLQHLKYLQVVTAFCLLILEDGRHKLEGPAEVFCQSLEAANYKFTKYSLQMHIKILIHVHFL